MKQIFLKPTLMFVHRINNECIKNREARISIDLVKDEVENSLEREVENIKTYQQRMQKMLAKVNQQIETNHSMQVGSYNIDNDVWAIKSAILVFL